MVDNVASVPPVKIFASENTDLAAYSPPAKPQSPKTAVEEKGESSNYRLTIETAENGRYIYTVSDPVTGQVVLKLPREVVQDLAKDPDYKGGNLLKTSI